MLFSLITSLEFLKLEIRGVLFYWLDASLTQTLEPPQILTGIDLSNSQTLGTIGSFSKDQGPLTLLEKKRAVAFKYFGHFVTTDVTREIRFGGIGASAFEEPAPVLFLQVTRQLTWLRPKLRHPFGKRQKRQTCGSTVNRANEEPRWVTQLSTMH